MSLIQRSFLTGFSLLLLVCGAVFCQSAFSGSLTSARDTPEVSEGPYGGYIFGDEYPCAKYLMGTNVSEGAHLSGEPGKVIRRTAKERLIVRPLEPGSQSPRSYLVAPPGFERPPESLRQVNYNKSTFNGFHWTQRRFQVDGVPYAVVNIGMRQLLKDQKFIAEQLIGVSREDPYIVRVSGEAEKAAIDFANLNSLVDESAREAYKRSIPKLSRQGDRYFEFADAIFEPHTNTDTIVILRESGDLLESLRRDPEELKSRIVLSVKLVRSQTRNILIPQNRRHQFEHLFSFLPHLYRLSGQRNLRAEVGYRYDDALRGFLITDDGRRLRQIAEVSRYVNHSAHTEYEAKSGRSSDFVVESNRWGRSLSVTRALHGVLMTQMLRTISEGPDAPEVLVANGDLSSRSGPNYEKNFFKYIPGVSDYLNLLPEGSRPGDRPEEYRIFLDLEKDLTNLREKLRRLQRKVVWY